MKHYEIQVTCQYLDSLERHLGFESFTEHVVAQHMNSAMSKAEKIAIKKMKDNGRVNPRVFFFDSILELPCSAF